MDDAGCHPDDLQHKYNYEYKNRFLTCEYHIRPSAIIDLAKL